MRTPFDVMTEFRRAWFDRDREKPDEVAAAIVETVKDIEQRQTSIYEGNKRHARVYAGYLPHGLAWGASVNQRAPFRATRGLVRSVCDTATALISRFRPKPAIVTSGAKWEVQQQAMDLDLFLQGAYRRGHVYEAAARGFHDSTIFGTGGYKLVARGRGDDWYVAAERFLIDDLIVDEDECRSGEEPECTYHRVLVSRDALIRRYAADDPDLARKISAAGENGSWPNRPVPKGKVVLIEAIHVDPVGSKHRRVLCGPGFVVKDETWPYDWHPYILLWWVPPITGFYGDGVAYRQFGRQERVTYMYAWAQKVQDLFGRPTAWVDPMGGPPTLQLSNEIGAVVSTRRPPVFQTQEMMRSEWYAWLDRLERGCFDDEGISQATAANDLPPGLESAPAQREYSFKETNRFAPVSQRWERAVAETTAERMTDMYRNRAASHGGTEMRWASRSSLHTVKWPDLDRDAFQIRAEASSLEALSPAARLQAAIELSQTQWLMPGEGRALLGHPDLEESDRLDNAAMHYAKQVLSQLLRGENVEVDEYADLPTLDAVIRRGRLWAKTRKAPKHLIDNCSDFLDRLDAEVRKAAQVMSGPPGAGGDPAAAGGPAPGGEMAPGPIGPEAAAGMPAPFPGQ